MCVRVHHMIAAMCALNQTNGNNNAINKIQLEKKICTKEIDQSNLCFVQL